jgi:predicted nucleic acid-binding protein
MMVADASALYKLVIEEKHSDLVRKIVQEGVATGEPVEVPDLAVSEVLNIAWVDYKVKKSISEAVFETAIANLDKIIGDLDIIPAKSLKAVAVKIAVLKGITVYDAMYVSASLLKGAPLLSFDRKMQDAAAELGINVLEHK